MHGQTSGKHRYTRVAIVLILSGLALGVGSLTSLVWTAEQAKLPQDGEIPLPSNYKTWPIFLSSVQRADVSQVRDIYLNPTGASASYGQVFPDGTVMVMELYHATTDGESLRTDSGGQPVRRDLAKVFVMQKERGWGQNVPDNLKSGNWMFAAYGSDGKALAEDFSKCRACHIPLAQKDFVHRYDEYFEKRGHH